MLKTYRTDDKELDDWRLEVYSVEMLKFFDDGRGMHGSMLYVISIPSSPLVGLCCTPFLFPPSTLFIPVSIKEETSDDDDNNEGKRRQRDDDNNDSNHDGNKKVLSAVAEGGVGPPLMSMSTGTVTGISTFQTITSTTKSVNPNLQPPPTPSVPGSVFSSTPVVAVG